MNKEFLYMQKLAGVITESEYVAKLNENEVVNKLKREIQKEYPNIVQDGEIETGTEEWIYLLRDALGLEYPYFKNIDAYDLFINKDYEKYQDKIEDLFQRNNITDLDNFYIKFEGSDLINNFTDDLGEESRGDLKDGHLLMQYAVEKFYQDVPVRELEQALEELGVEII